MNLNVSKALLAVGLGVLGCSSADGEPRSAPTGLGGSGGSAGSVGGAGVVVDSGAGAWTGGGAGDSAAAGMGGQAGTSGSGGAGPGGAAGSAGGGGAGAGSDAGTTACSTQPVLSGATSPPAGTSGAEVQGASAAGAKLDFSVCGMGKNSKQCAESTITLKHFTATGVVALPSGLTQPTLKQVTGSGSALDFTICGLSKNGSQCHIQSVKLTGAVASGTAAAPVGYPHAHQLTKVVGTGSNLDFTICGGNDKSQSKCATSSIVLKCTN